MQNREFNPYREFERQCWPISLKIVPFFKATANQYSVAGISPLPFKA